MNRGEFGGGASTGGTAEPASYVRALCNYSAQRTKLHDFLTNFTIDDPSAPVGAGKGKRGVKKNAPVKIKKYHQLIGQLDRRNQSVLDIRVDDIRDYYKNLPPEKSQDVLNTLSCNAPRAIRLLYDTVEDIRKEHFPPPENTVQSFQTRIQDMIAKAMDIPVIYRANFEIHLIPPAKSKSCAIHELRASNIGALITVDGTVCKITSVKPQLQIAVYRCDDCGAYQFQYVEGLTFKPLRDCQSTVCKSARKSDTLQLSLRDSKFIQRQEARIQELSSAVPPGAVPRQLKVVLKGKMTRIMKPGMAVRIGGVIIPEHERVYGRSGIGGGPCLMEAHWLDPSVGVMAGNSKDNEEVDWLCRNSSSEELYSRLSASIAPTIHGFEDVKKVLLLQLVGGVSQAQGIKVRGDIHVLLMGDPGIAKSQLLLRMCAVAPRAHYTCGKGASGVGLTASVMKDPLTGEFTLEGGAIVLADNGVCCVDEFDKLQEADRTAIHEVMEQQTVSISKAGLNATLNARTTILAAANPVMGRYDVTKSAVANIGLPAALLSRFDVVFLLLDDGGVYHKDLAMARHLLSVHKECKVQQITAADGEEYKPLSAEVLRAIIRRAHAYSPKLTSELAADVCDHYVTMRMESKANATENYYITPRTLCAVLRLSQALARLRFSNTVIRSDFDEAVRLMRASADSVSFRQQGSVTSGIDDSRARVLKMIKEYPPMTWISFSDALTKIKDLNLSGGELEDTLESLAACGLLKWDGPRRSKFRVLGNNDDVN